MTSQNSTTKRFALLSVTNKSGLVELAQALINHQFSLLSTGGTAKFLRQHQIPLTEISDYTGFPEIMDGRVKSLHPKIFGGLLARPGTDDETLKTHGLNSIELAIINLYAF